MKTQLIPLEAHDDLISIRDRMSWAKTPRILLVWPKAIKIPLRALDLKVLQRHALSLGAQLGLVTRHRSIRREAQSLGIPVFNTTGEAQRHPWPETDLREKHQKRTPRKDLRKLRDQIRGRKDSWQEHPVVRVIFFALAVFSVLAIASLFIPHATITLIPETATQTITLPVQADPSINDVFITGSVPAQKMIVSVDGNWEALATGKMPVPETKSTGVVTFRNLTQSDIIIYPGTILTSIGLPGVRFITLEEVTLPGELKETVDVPIEAELAGEAGNVEAETILAIEGDLGLQVAVINEEPTTGGSDRSDVAPTETDTARLRETLLNELRRKALQGFQNLIRPEDQLFEGTLAIEEIIEERYDPPLGQPGRKVTLTLKIEFTAYYVSQDDLEELARTVLNTSVPDSFLDTGDPLKFEKIDTPRTDSENVTRWVMRVSRKLKKQPDTGQVIPLVRGRDIQTAAKNLEKGLGLDYTPQIKLAPEWWPWIPSIPFNISIETE